MTLPNGSKAWVDSSSPVLFSHFHIMILQSSLTGQELYPTIALQFLLNSTPSNITLSRTPTLDTVFFSNYFDPFRFVHSLLSFLLTVNVKCQHDLLQKHKPFNSCAESCIMLITAKGLIRRYLTFCTV